MTNSESVNKEAEVEVMSGDSSFFILIRNIEYQTTNVVVFNKCPA